MARKAIPQRIKYQILIKQRGLCVDCNELIKYPEFHHKDGDNTNSFEENNIIALCPNCHRARHSRDRDSVSLEEEKKDSGDILDFKLPKFDLSKFELPKFNLKDFNK